MAEKERYDAKAVEEKWKKYWEEQKIYKFNENTKKKTFSIDTPPPTVSGRMHIGHAFSYAQQDFIARYQRMKTETIFYPFGTDDNGLPTERLIERLNKVKSKEMSREKFVELCLKTLKKILPEFIEDWKILGISCDYDVYYSTIDKNSQKLSQASFIESYKKKLIYNDEFPTIWCPECQTPIAQAELEDKEQGSEFSTLKFKIADSGKDLLIATTRPELLPACVAVFVHPNDKRYKGLVGKKAKVPLFNQEVPIFSDASAEMEKGTGVLMICSYGDKYDVDAIKRKKLKPRIVLSKDGKLNSTKYKGLGIKEARRKILDDLDKGRLIAEKKLISHTVNVHDKCGTEIEFLPVKQWFIKILDKKKKLIEQGKKVKWYPKYMFKRYANWINGLEWDWSISRNRHFGIPIPLWQCEKCKETILPKENELPVNPISIKKKCSKCGGVAVGERDVLDTWATSSLTPQIADSLINNKIGLPFSLRPQAHDIIRTWAFYTIVKALYHENKIPWKDIVISGHALDPIGKKMSKSKGNVVEPQEVIKKFGVDELRYWAASSKLGEDLAYQEEDLMNGKRFITKLFNASRFVFMNLKNKPKKPAKLEVMDKWLLSKLGKIIKECTDNFEQYEYSKTKSLSESFFWNVFCDNYLEIVKRRIYNGKGNEKASAEYVLYCGLLNLIKLIAPIMPFITEEIYQNYFKKYEKEKSIHISEWPKPLASDSTAEKIGDKFIELLGKIRQEKSRAAKSVGAEIVLSLEKKDLNVIKPALEDFKAVTRACEIKEGNFKLDFI